MQRKRNLKTSITCVLLGDERVWRHCSFSGVYNCTGEKERRGSLGKAWLGVNHPQGRHLIPLGKKKKLTLNSESDSRRKTIRQHRKTNSRSRDHRHGNQQKAAKWSLGWHTSDKLHQWPQLSAPPYFWMLLWRPPLWMRAFSASWLWAQTCDFLRYKWGVPVLRLDFKKSCVLPFALWYLCHSQEHTWAGLIVLAGRWEMHGAELFAANPSLDRQPQGNS